MHSSSAGQENWINALRKLLLKKYDVGTRPVNDHTSNTTVKLSLSLNNVELVNTIYIYYYLR